jgi:thiamine biosynthesis lipoprotein ApbE
VHVRQHPLETHLSVVGDPTLLESGRQRLRELRACRPPGLAVDEVVEELLADGAAGVLVQLDGIVRVAGTSPSGDGWLTVVAHPRGHFASAVLRLESGAVATMAQPGSEDLLAVSVVAGPAWEAELLASTALAAGLELSDERGYRGADAAERVLRTAGVPGLLIDAYDEARPVNGWERHSAAAGRLLHSV